MIFPTCSVARERKREEGERERKREKIWHVEVSSMNGRGTAFVGCSSSGVLKID